MRVVFRVDASRRIGTGHVMRCLSLADRLRARGHAILFLCRELQGELSAGIRTRGYRVEILSGSSADAAEADTAHGEWLETSQQHDAEQTLAVLQGEAGTDLVVVDHYALDASWERLVHQRTRLMMAIDDLADRPHHVELLLDQNYYPRAASRYDALLPDHAVLLCGPVHALLREEFTSIAQRPVLRERVRRVLIFFGGVDAGGHSSKAIDAVAGSGLALEVDVVIGGTNPHRATVQQQCEHNGFALHVDTNRMASLMQQADLFIGAGGTTSWERCYLGLPSITLTLADNQRAINRGLADIGACVHLGDADAVSADDIRGQLERLCQDSAALAELSRACGAIMQHYLGADDLVDRLEAMLESAHG